MVLGVTFGRWIRSRETRDRTLPFLERVLGKIDLCVMAFSLTPCQAQRLSYNPESIALMESTAPHFGLIKGTCFSRAPLLNAHAPPTDDRETPSLTNHY